MSMLAWAAVFAASALTAPLEEIYNDSPVVTNVTFEGLATTAQVRTEVAAATNAATRAATGYTDAATNATAAALRGEIGDATNGLLRAESDPAFAAWKKANSVAAGQSASAATLATAVGPLAKATELSSAAFGYNARANGVRSLALGYGARTTNEQSVAIGYGAVSHGINTFSVNAESPSAFYLGGSPLQSFLDLYVKFADFLVHTNDTSNPHGVTAAQVGALTKDEADAEYYPADEGALWSSWWSGDGFRVVVSNYDVSAAAEGTVWERLPAAAFEYRPGGTGELVRVWDERTRWERARASFGEFTNALELVLADKAGLDWGRTTPTGFDAPPGFTWLDTPAVAVAGGLAWQKTVTSEGAIWLLCSNGMVAELGSSAASTNGYFKITDERGETAFEIVQGDRRPVGANHGETYTWTAADGKTHLRVVYNVVSDTAPTLHVATSLQAGAATVWKDEGADGCPASFAGWTGSSGAWTNALWRTSAPSAGETDALFCYATYESGGETVVKNHAPVALSKLVLGGVTYTVGTAEISGHTVLTLTPQGGN